jgi:spore germination protein KC
MKIKPLNHIVVILTVTLLTTGCWDRTELNDQALVMASGVDLTPDNELLLTDQVVLPINLSKGLGSSRQEFLTLSATGRDILDASQNLQSKLSRKYFLGHRRIVFIGEKAAKHGLSHMMDEYTRNPDVRLRSDIFVVKNNTATQALQIKAPLEQFPALAVIKSRQFVGGKVGTTLVSFLRAGACNTSCPTLPVLEIVTGTTDSDEQVLQFSGRAIFDRQLKLVGYLDYYGAAYRFWVMNTLTRFKTTFYVPEGKGYATMDVSHFGSRIEPILKDGKLQYVVTLGGKGILRESETSIKFKNPKQLEILNRAAEAEVVKNASQVISTAQGYHTDILGFDMAMARKYPRQWKVMKSQWNKIFPDLPVHVRAHIQIRVVGLTSESVVSPKYSGKDRSW